MVLKYTTFICSWTGTYGADNSIHKVEKGPRIGQYIFKVKTSSGARIKFMREQEVNTLIEGLKNGKS